ncbi:phasin family protein [Micromonospora sp. CPCC 205561]|uniref:phasin family protein n=1 Tax=Micromonospora sp. CPCC 205561 TaxID=3122407 RepID=UPI002FF187DA
MQDAWRAYLELAMGLTEAPRKKAQDAARRLVGSGGATAAQLQSLAEELVSTSAANREALTKLVRFEVDRALGAVGLATADEVAELTRRVHELERQLRDAKATLGAAAPGPAAAPAAGSGSAPGTAAGSGSAGAAGSTVVPAAAPGGAAPPATPGGAEPAVPTSASPAVDVVAGPAAPTKAVAKKTVAKKAVAKKAVAKKAVAKRDPSAVVPAEDGGAEPARPVKRAPAAKRSPEGEA